MKTIQWYPGHMAKTKRLIQENIKLVDIVFELVDARAPFSTQNPMVQDITKHKPRIILLNKSDLAEQKELDKWVDYFNDQGTKAFKINSMSGFNVDKIVSASQEIMAEKFAKNKKRGIFERPIRAMIVGIPNVGKSTLINQLVKKRVTKVGDVAGITKHLQMIRIHEHLELLDTPGILWPKFEDQEAAKKLVLLGSLKDSITPLDDVAIFGMHVLATHYKNAFETRYDIEVDMDNVIKVFDDIGKRRGCLKKGGIVDYDRVIEIFIYDFRHHYFGNIILDRVKD